MPPVTITRAYPDRGTVALRIGLGLVLAAFVIGTPLVVSGIRRADDTVRGYQRMPISTGGTFSISEAGTYRIYLEYPGAHFSGGRRHGSGVSQGPAEDLEARLGILVTVTGPSGPVAVLREDHSESYRLVGRTGRLLGTFRAQTAGTYAISTLTGEGAPSVGNVAVGTGSPLDSSARSVVGAVGGLVLFTLGLFIASRQSRLRTVPPPEGTVWNPPPSAPVSAPEGQASS